MRMYSFKTAGTLSKAEQIDKVLRRGSLPLLLGLTIFCAEMAGAAAIPVTLTWFQPQGRTNKYVVEISDDAKFGTTTAKSEVSGNTLVWQAPKEGVFHWRVTPVDRIAATDKNQVVETSSVASGSFVAIDAGPVNEPVTIRWSDDPSVTAYHLKVQEDGRDGKTMISLVPTHNFARSPKPFSLQIIPHGKSNTNKVARNAVVRFDPNLEIVKNTPPPPVAPPPPRELVMGNDPIPEQPRTIEALPPAPAPVELSKERPIDELLIPENRVMELLVAGYYGIDRTFSARGPVTTRYSQNYVPGGMMSYRAVPVSGLHLQASGTIHQNKVKWRDQNRQDVITQSTNSYFGQVGVGFDLFFRNPNRRHQLVLDVRGAMASIYDLAYETNDLNSENLKLQNLQLWGGGAWYRWTARRWGLGGGWMSLFQTVHRKRDNDSSVDEWSLFASMDPIPYMTISIGGFTRMTVVRRCSSDATVCADQGASASRNILQAGYLGLGYVLY